MILRTVAFVALFYVTEGLRLKERGKSQSRTTADENITEDVIPGIPKEAGPPIHPKFEIGKYSREFQSADSQCTLTVYSDIPEPSKAVPVDPYNMSVCLTDRDTTEIIAEVDDHGLAILTYNSPATRGHHMDVTLECIDVSGKLIGRMKTTQFKYVPSDSDDATSWGWIIPQFITDLTSGDKDHPFFQVIVDASKVEAVEREFVAPLHKTAAAKYCKQMKDSRDRVYGTSAPILPLPSEMDSTR
jgi:hypothetical protein